MSSKKLITGLTILMVVALATIGIAYGAWTDQLNINGNVTTGTFDVDFQNMYYDWDATPECTAAISGDGNTLTVSVINAYPGLHCGGGVGIKNLSSIPAKINGLVEVTNTVPVPFRGGAGLVFMTNAGGGQVPAGGSFVLAAGATGGGVMWDFTIPAAETGHQGETYNFSYTILAEQAP
jgi:hypothetical protein